MMNTYTVKMSISLHEYFGYGTTDIQSKQLEAKIETLFHKQDRLCLEIKALSKSLRNRKLWDTFKVVTGAAIGGFAAIAAKTMIWK